MKRILGRISKEVVNKYDLQEHEDKKIVLYDNDRRHCENKHAHQFKDKKTFHYIMNHLEYIIEEPDLVFYVKGYDVIYDKETKTKSKVERYSLEYYKKFEDDVTVRVKVDDGRELRVKTVFPVNGEKVKNKLKAEIYNKYVMSEDEFKERNNLQMQ